MKSCDEDFFWAGGEYYWWFCELKHGTDRPKTIEMVPEWRRSATGWTMKKNALQWVPASIYQFCAKLQDLKHSKMRKVSYHFSTNCNCHTETSCWLGYNTSTISVYLELVSEQVVCSQSKPNVADCVILWRNMKLFIKNTVNDQLSKQPLSVHAVKSKLTAAVIHATTVMSTVQHLRILRAFTQTFHHHCVSCCTQTGMTVQIFTQHELDCCKSHKQWQMQIWQQCSCQFNWLKDIQWPMPDNFTELILLNAEDCISTKR